MYFLEREKGKILRNKGDLADKTAMIIEINGNSSHKKRAIDIFSTQKTQRHKRRKSGGFRILRLRRLSE